LLKALLAGLTFKFRASYFTGRNKNAELGGA
jgi:hypothetical protein